MSIPRGRVGRHGVRVGNGQWSHQAITARLGRAPMTADALAQDVRQRPTEGAAQVGVSTSQRIVTCSSARERP